MISTPDRQTAIALIDDAVTAGARRAKACCELEISERTLRRWTKDGEVRPDQRPVVPRPQPANALSAAERAAVLDVCNSKEFSSLPPSQIVPKLADQGRYLASESSFYRILHATGLQHHRGRAKSPVKRKPPTSYQASASCEVWTWDITWMPGPVAGMFFYLYLIVDIFSRKIVGWEVHERESADLAAILIRQGADECAKLARSASATGRFRSSQLLSSVLTTATTAPETSTIFTPEIAKSASAKGAPCAAAALGKLAKAPSCTSRSNTKRMLCGSAGEVSARIRLDSVTSDIFNLGGQHAAQVTIGVNARTVAITETDADGIVSKAPYPRR